MITPAEIKAQRKALGLRQLDISTVVGVSLGAYRLWELGGSKPTAENEAKLRAVLKLGRDDDDAKGPEQAAHTA